MPSLQLETGTIPYEEAGPPSGRPIVFVHGYLMGGSLWREVSTRLAARGLRCLAPTWPLGAQPSAFGPSVDLSPTGLASIIARFLDELELSDVVLVGNDSGTALCQLVAVSSPSRLGALVLTNGDAFENFPPSFFKALVAAARVPAGFRTAIATMKTAAGRRSPVGYGLLSHGDVDALAAEWVKPVFADAGVMEDLRRLTLGLRSEVLVAAARELPSFDRPVLLAWALDDKLFPLRDAERLAAVFPDARLETIPGSRAFSMVDAPDRLAALIGDFAAVPEAAAA